MRTSSPMISIVDDDRSVRRALRRLVQSAGYSGLPLAQYETALGDYLRNYCHRGGGWTPDKRVRDTGPFVGTMVDGKWVGKYYGTHNPVWVWYSRDMVEWLRRNRPNGG